VGSQGIAPYNSSVGGHPWIPSSDHVLDNSDLGSYPYDLDETLCAGMAHNSKNNGVR